MSSTTDSDDPIPRDNIRLFSPNGVMKEIMLKILVIGDYGVGKTALVRRYTEGKFSSNYKITIGADFSMKSFLWDSSTQVSVQLWDIAGHERLGHMTRVYYKYALGAAIVFDVSRIATFQSVIKWLNDVRDKIMLSDGSPIPVVLLANKCDIAGVNIPTDSINRLCREAEINKWFLTSAKDNKNVEEAMSFLIESAMKHKAKETAEQTEAISLHSERNLNVSYEKDKLCCY